MRFRRPKEPQPTGYVGDHADKLSRVRPFPRSEDPERPSGAHRETYRTPIDSINEAVFPGWGRSWGRRRKRKS